MERCHNGRWAKQLLLAHEVLGAPGGWAGPMWPVRTRSRADVATRGQGPRVVHSGTEQGAVADDCQGVTLQTLRIVPSPL